MALQRVYSAAEVVEAFTSGNDKVLAAIYKEHYGAVQHYILQNSGSADDARDIYQEAILALWTNVQNGKFHAGSDSNIGGYLYQVARHKWLDKLKSKHHRSTLRMVQDSPPDTSDDGLAESEAREEQFEALHHYFQRLGDTCKSILRKFYYEKKSLEEIGADLQYDAATMRTKKYRCMMQLRKMHDAQQP